MINPAILGKIENTVGLFLNQRATISQVEADEFGRGASVVNQIATDVPCRIIRSRGGSSASQELGVTDTDTTDLAIVFKKGVTIPPDARISVGGEEMSVVDVSDLLTDKVFTLVWAERLRQ